MFKSNIGPPTVAYEMPVQLDDIAPPEITTTVVPISPLRPVMPIDNLVVQGLPANITPRQLPVSSVHRPDTAHALTSNFHAPDASTDNCHGAGVLTSRPPYFSSAVDESTGCRAGPCELPQPSGPGSHHESDTLPRQLVTRATVTDSVHTFSRELLQPSAPSNPGYTHTPPHLQLRTFPRLPPQPACTQSTMTSMLPRTPPIVPVDDVLTSALPRTLTLVGPPSREDVVTSALPRPLTAAADFAYDTTQRPVDCVDNRNNVYTHSVEQWLPQLPPPPHICRQPIVPLSSVCTQTTASACVNTDSIPVLSAHRYADNYQNVSANLSLPPLSTHTNVPTNVNSPSSQAIALGQSNITDVPNLYAASYASNLNSSSIVAFSPSVCTSYVDNS